MPTITPDHPAKNEPGEFDAFRNLVDRVISVPHNEIKKREERYREGAAKNPRKRGPKPKTTRASSSPVQNVQR